MTGSAGQHSGGHGPEHSTQRAAAQQPVHAENDARHSQGRGPSGRSEPTARRFERDRSHPGQIADSITISNDTGKRRSAGPGLQRLASILPEWRQPFSQLLPASATAFRVEKIGEARTNGDAAQKGFGAGHGQSPKTARERLAYEKLRFCRKPSVTPLTSFWRHPTRQCTPEMVKLRALEDQAPAFPRSDRVDLELAGAGGLL